MSHPAVVDKWDHFKDEIHTLFITKNLPLKGPNGVIEVMRLQFGFDASKAQYERRFKEWDFRKYAKGAQPKDWQIVQRKLKSAKARLANTGKEPRVFYRGKPVTDKVLNNRGFMTLPEQMALEQAPSPRTPPEFSIQMSPPSPIIQLNHGKAWSTTLGLDNLPWFEFQDSFYAFLKTQGINLGDRIVSKAAVEDTAYHLLLCPPSANHICFPNIPGPGSVLSDLQLDLFMSEESLNVRYYLDLLGRESARGLGTLDEASFGAIVDFLFTRWTAASPAILDTDEYMFRTLHSYFRPFILESQDGELLDGVRIVFGPLCYALLQFLSYTVNLISNNLLPEREIYNIVRWIDEIQGHRLLTSILCLKVPTVKAFASNLLPGSLRLKSTSIAGILLDAGANPNAPMGYGRLYPLQYAAMVGSNELARLLLKVGANVNANNPHSGTALHAAAQNGNIELVQILLAAGANVNPFPRLFSARPTALQAAAGNGNIELVQILLAAGANVNTPASIYHHGRTALQAAVENRNKELVQILLEAGADINACPSPPRGCKITALQAAAGIGDIKPVQILLEAGADVNAAPGGGHTAIQAAAEKGSIELVQILLDAGADINGPPSRYVGRTALQAAAENGHIELVQILLKAGADVNACPSFYVGRSALQAAAKNGNTELVRTLLRAGADVNAPRSCYHERTALEVAVVEGYVELVKILIEAGADVNDCSPNFERYNALQGAAKNGNIELVQILLTAGANVNTPPSNNYYGRTALQAAVENGHVKLVQILLTAGADINAPPSEHGGVTAIQAAAIRGNIRLALLLCNAGADVNAAPAIKNGRTALEGAAEHCRIDLLQLLINAGADLSSPQLTRALEFAAREGYDAVCMLLDRFRKGEGRPRGSECAAISIQAPLTMP